MSRLTIVEAILVVLMLGGMVVWTVLDKRHKRTEDNT